jgi:hypothetical protein
MITIDLLCNFGFYFPPLELNTGSSYFDVWNFSIIYITLWNFCFNETIWLYQISLYHLLLIWQSRDIVVLVQVCQTYFLLLQKTAMPTLPNLHIYYYTGTINFKDNKCTNLSLDKAWQRSSSHIYMRENYSLDQVP